MVSRVEGPNHDHLEVDDELAQGMVVMSERRRYERTPDTLVILHLIAATGVLLTLLGEAPRSINESTPRWAGILWSGAFSASAVIALAGVLHREPATGWLLELVGRAGLAFGAMGYIAALAYNNSTLNTLWTVAFVGGVGLSSLWRVIQLEQRLRTLRQALKAAGEMKPRGET